MAAIAVDRDHLAGKLDELAEGAARHQLDKAATAPRDNGTPRFGHVYWTGYLHGLCAAIAAITGESSADLINRFEGVTPVAWDGR